MGPIQSLLISEKGGPPSASRDWTGWEDDSLSFVRGAIQATGDAL